MATCTELTESLSSLSTLREQLEPSILGKLKAWEKRSNSINILVSGKTGTGKSTLVNSIIGRAVTKEGDKLNP